MADDRKTIGKYEIVSELGRGGMGVVFKAWEESLQRFVAIKMLADQLTSDESLVARFLREARSVADLNHPNVVQVFSVDTHDGRPYFAMEFVEGDSLTSLIRTSGKIEPSRAVTILKEVARGLSAAHDKGVVHRDIKPDNIMLTKHGGVKVVDFGVARVENPTTKLTATGMAVGTPNYLSPEVCLGLDVDQRSDLFSMGVVLYEMLTGRTPFDADSPLEMMTNVVKAEVPDIEALNPGVDDNLRLILNHLLEKKPEYRYQNFHQVLEDIAAYRAGSRLPHAAKAASQPTMKVATGELAGIKAGAAPEQSEAKSRPWPLAAGLLLAAIAAGAAGWQYLGPGFGSPGMADSAPTLDVDESLPEPPPQAASGAANIALDMPADDAGRASVFDDMADESPAIEEPADAMDSAVSMTTGTAGGLPRLATDDASSAGDVAAPAGPAESRAAPAEPAPPDYREPNVVVIVNGDPAVSATIETTLESALAGAKFTVMNEQFFDGYRSGIDVARLADVVVRNRGNIVVLADIRETGTRQLEFYGRQDVQTLATLNVTAMLPVERRNLGAPWQANLQYTGLNAAEQGRNAAEPIARELIERLNELKTSQ